MQQQDCLCHWEKEGEMKSDKRLSLNCLMTMMMMQALSLWKRLQRQRLRQKRIAKQRRLDNDQKKPAAVPTTAKETVDLLSSSDSEQEVPNNKESENNSDIIAAANDETSYIAQELAKFPLPRNIGPYPFEEAQDLFDQALSMFKEGHGKDFEAFQRSSIFRDFTPEDATDSQTMAQYGYAKPRFTKVCLTNGVVPPCFLL